MMSAQVRQSGERQLTRAEREVLAVLLTGVHNRQIAEQLFVTEATVRTHLTHIYSKLEVDGRAALIATFRDDLSLRSSEPLPTKPRRGIRPWIILGVAATIIAWVVATSAFSEVRERAPSLAPISAPALRVAVDPNAASAPAFRTLDGQTDKPTWP
jgi:Response regulator containing a CheY-like receiver domain and an HTH DNA-binding domain